VSNGSDLTALFVGEAVRAEEVQLWKSVPGILTADPRLIPAARTIAEAGRDEALELALHGARVLHPDAARSAGPVRVRVLDARSPDAPGTTLVDRTPSRGPLALVHRRGLARARIEARADELGALLAELERRDARTPWLEARAGEARIVAPEDAARAVLEPAGARLEGGLAAVALVGRRVGGDARLAERALGRLRRLGLTVRAASVGARESSQAWLFAEEEVEPALRGLHAWLFEEPVRRAAAGRTGAPVGPGT
jgi:aspartokinase